MNRLSIVAILLVFVSHTDTIAQVLDSTLEDSRKTWNERLTRDTVFRFSKEVNALLAEVSRGLKPGTALDVGMGIGRNSIFLARQGWQVTGFDIADEAVAKAIEQARKENLNITSSLQSIESFDFGIDRWDLVAYVYEGCMEKSDLARIKKGIKPGGVIVFEFFHREAGIKMRRPDFGCESGTMKKLFEDVGGFTVDRYAEAESIADYSLKKYKMVKLVATRNRH